MVLEDNLFPVWILTMESYLEYYFGQTYYYLQFTLRLFCKMAEFVILKLHFRAILIW